MWILERKCNRCGERKASIRFWDKRYENWCEYTGLKDKNSRKIYEGDILLLGGIVKHIVEWKEEKTNRTYGHGDYGQSLLVGFYFDGWAGLPESGEVIGNIYENPELLK